MPTHRRVTFAQDVVDDLRKMLREAPEPSKDKPAEYSKLGLVRDLAPELRALARRGWSWKALAAMMSPRVAISPDLLQSYVRGRSRAPRKGKAERVAAAPSGDRPGAPKAVAANGTSTSLPMPPAPPARINDERPAASTSRGRPDAPKAVAANVTSRSPPVLPAPPARTNDAPGKDLPADDASGTDDDHVTGRVGAS
jgi:hypothetical protein